jgi:hypothetical protein
MNRNGQKVWVTAEGIDLIPQMKYGELALPDPKQKASPFAEIWL